MNVNLRLSGDLEHFISSLVDRGLAANKTDAIRLAVVRYYEQYNDVEKDRAQEAFTKAGLRNAWDNPGDDKVEEFYTKRYLRGPKKKRRTLRRL